MPTSHISTDSVPGRGPNRIEVVTLHKSVYDELAKKFRPLVVTEATTQIQVGYALGVQAVLKALRDGLVVG